MDAFKIRAQAYWSYFAGGYHTYGNTNTWNFGTFRPEATDDWVRALDSAGASHLSVLAAVFTSLPWWTMEPDPALFASEAIPGALRNAALRSADGRTALVYAPSAGTFALNLDRVAASGRVSAVWIDPQTGFRAAVGEVPAVGTASFSTPHGWADSLLLLESGVAGGVAGQ
jgi:hypothetical protein